MYPSVICKRIAANMLLTIKSGIIHTLFPKSKIPAIIVPIQRIPTYQYFFREYTAAVIRIMFITQTMLPKISMGFQRETASKTVKSAAVFVKIV